MATLLHLSDLHFGAHNPAIVEALECHINEAKADLIVISGDLTQRAKKAEFEEACAFLTRVRESGHQVLVIPGNHDIPLYDVLRRFLSPLTRYRKYIDETLCPFHELDGVSVLGINTARSATFKGGSISHEQRDLIRETFGKTDAAKVRVLVTHHPLFALPTGGGEALGAPVDHQQEALSEVAELGIDLLLAGHNHLASSSANALVHGSGRALVVQAGTATSTRVRGQGQSFNRIEIEPGKVRVTIKQWSGTRFETGDSQCFVQRGEHWDLVGGPEATPVPEKVAQ